MKIIFLDIDGVMNSTLSKGPYISDMEIEKIELLSNLIKSLSISTIVITSDRRYSKYDMKEKIEAFRSYSIDIPITITRRESLDDPYDNRGKQILDYISSIEEDIESIVILDDNDDGISSLFPDQYIHIDSRHGLDKNVFNRVREIFNN